ncbi:hypothetical protein HNQ60_002804 [Povalibacter uvarum]|uniref:Uncharacterized protein n=1 Tax=Povalibacter uvarum TaxID=732238 RepID=A0A841HMF1_9GAMM|nr:hypothetical protein [Povalibacter uvarum]MBB6093923.1 hypothetical protein [Povalibacter uvarum]
MFALTEFSRRTQQTLCLLMSAVIVAFQLAAAVYPAHMASNPGYSVTVTQIQ